MLFRSYDRTKGLLLNNGLKEARTIDNTGVYLRFVGTKLVLQVFGSR